MQHVLYGVNPDAGNMLIVCSDKPNVIAQSKGGSGKTGAFGLAMLNSIDCSLKQPQAVCISPTKDLAMQTASRLRVRHFSGDCALCVQALNFMCVL
jgi:superfamily II DNA/RNA helicase